MGGQITSGQSNLTTGGSCRTWTVQWYSPDGASVQPHIIHASSGPPESKPQTASRSVQPFSHNSPQSVPILHNGSPLPRSKLPLPMGDLDPIYYMVLWAYPSPQPERHLDRFSRFCRAHCDRQTDRQTDRPSDLANRSVTIGRIYVRSRLLRCGVKIDSETASAA